MDLVSRDNRGFANTAANLSKVVCLEPLWFRGLNLGIADKCNDAIARGDVMFQFLQQ